MSNNTRAFLDMHTASIACNNTLHDGPRLLQNYTIKTAGIDLWTFV